MGVMFWIWTLSWIATWVLLIAIYFIKAKENKE